MAPFHKNPPSLNTLLLSNGQYKNERKLNNGLKHLFGDLVSFGRHMITRSLPGVNPTMHLCFWPFRQLFPFFVFSCLETKFKIPHISHKFFSKAPFHKNPPSFNTSVLSNGKDKNERKLNGQSSILFGDLVTFARHIITWSLLGVGTQPCTCASRPFGSCFNILFFPA